MDYAQYKKLKEEIDADYQKKKDALEMLWSMYQKPNGASSSPSESYSRGSGASVSDAIRKVLSGLEGDFTVDDIQQGLTDHGIKGVARLSITNTLHRLWRRKEIDLVKKGQGRTASIYRKIQKELL